MNPGAIAEVGKVAANTIDALKTQPMMLALVVLQIFVVGAVLYNNIHRQTAIDSQFKQIFDLLATCMKGNLPT